MKNHLFRNALASIVTLASLLLLAPATSFAGEQYIDKTGFAVSGYDVVAYRSLKQKKIGKKQKKAVAGKAGITTQWNGAKWAFASTKNRDMFLENPEYYAPQYDGHCAYGASLNGKVPANPNLWRVVDDKLYLNVTKVVVGLWEKDTKGDIVKADKNWTSLEAKAASTGKVPEFDTAKAPKN